MSKFQIRYFTKLLIFFLVLLQLPSVDAKLSCRQYFGSHKFGDSILAYASDVGRTRGGRLILANPDPKPETRMLGLLMKEQMPQHKWGVVSSPFHFFNYYIPHKVVDVSSYSTQRALNLLRKVAHKPTTSQRTIKEILKASPGEWRFAPFQMLERYLIDRPTEVLSQEMLYTKKRLSLLVKLPLFIFLTIKGYEHVDNHLWAKFDSNLEQNITEVAHREPHTFIKLAQTDYRYNAYKNEIYKSDGTINMSTVVDIAAHNRIYYEYYSARDQLTERLTLEQEVSMFSRNSLFAGIQKLAESDLKPTAQQDVKQPGPVPAEKQDMLYKLRHLLLYQYQLVDVWIFVANPPRSALDQEQIAQTLLNDPYIQILKSKLSKNEITEIQARYLAQKYLENVHFLSIFDLLGITFYLDANKSEPLTMETVRLDAAQSLREILNQ